MTSVRYPAVAGMFYPNDPGELDKMIRTFLTSAEVEGSVPKALIAPHAGYIYSGPVAASAYRLLIPAKNGIKRVILLGPAHRVPFRGLAVPSVDCFITPLGTVAVDKEAIAKITDLPFFYPFIRCSPRTGTQPGGPPAVFAGGAGRFQGGPHRRR